MLSMALDSNQLTSLVDEFDFFQHYVENKIVIKKFNYNITLIPFNLQ